MEGCAIPQPKTISPCQPAMATTAPCYPAYPTTPPPVAIYTAQDRPTNHSLREPHKLLYLASAISRIAVPAISRRCRADKTLDAGKRRVSGSTLAATRYGIKQPHASAVTSPRPDQGNGTIIRSQTQSWPAEARCDAAHRRTAAFCGLRAMSWDASTRLQRLLVYDTIFKSKTCLLS